MSWYYAENNERRGPVDDATFHSLIAAQTIKPDTLVWHDGMTNWVPYSSVAAEVLAASASPAVGVGMLGTGAVACSQCGRSFPADETVTYDGRHVCAECKPLFFQKVKEGVSILGQQQHEFGGFWIRFGAKFLDGIILQVAGTIVGFFIGLAFHNNVGTIFAMFVGMVINASYMIYFVGKRGATPGKMACNLQIVCADGSPMTYGRATGRYFAEIVSSLTLGIGFIMAGFDEEKRALHDRICDTRVIHKPNR